MVGVKNEDGSEGELKMIGKVWAMEDLEKIAKEIVSDTLREADRIIHGERQDQYGSPEDSFALIAEYWTSYLCAKFKKNQDDSIEAADVAVMMALFKLARMSGQQWHRDNAVDACGYLAILNDRIHIEKGE